MDWGPTMPDVSLIFSSTRPQNHLHTTCFIPISKVLCIVQKYSSTYLIQSPILLKTQCPPTVAFSSSLQRVHLFQFIQRLEQQQQQKLSQSDPLSIAALCLFPFNTCKLHCSLTSSLNHQVPRYNDYAADRGRQRRYCKIRKKQKEKDENRFS